MLEEMSIRLNKFISDSGICSRREADRLIEQGKVYINGCKAKIGDLVYPGDTVNANGQLLEEKSVDDFIFIAFNKPVGVTSTTERSDKTNIIDYINHSQRIFPIGRLDKDSQGLIFLTDNGDLVNKILRAGNKHEKEYLVTVNKPITAQFIEGMGNGVPILGEMTKKCQVRQETPFIFRIVLIQGLNRQIRRMCEYFGYDVTKLERVRIMNIRLKGLPLGDWRDLEQEEVASILSMLEHSSSQAATTGKNSAKPAANATTARAKPRKTFNAAAGDFKNSSQRKPPHRPPNAKGSGTKAAAPSGTKAKAPSGKAKPFGATAAAKAEKLVSGNKATRRSADWKKQDASPAALAAGKKAPGNGPKVAHTKLHSATKQRRAGPGKK